MDLRAAATRISALLPSNFAEAADSPLVPAQLSYGGLAGVLTLGDTEELAADRCSECADANSAASLAGDSSEDADDDALEGGAVAEQQQQQQQPARDGVFVRTLFASGGASA